MESLSSHIVLRSLSGRKAALTLLTCLLVLSPSDAVGQKSGEMPAVYEGAGLEEQLGNRLPLDVRLIDERGAEVTLQSLIPKDRPVLLNFVYYNCPMLCSLLLDGLTNALRGLDWTPGEQYDVITVSFASNETPDLAARQKEKYLSQFPGTDAADGWHFLTAGEDAVQRLAGAVGFQFKWVEEQQEYVHPAVLVFVSPSGTITRYLHGVQFSSRDVRTALVEASEGRVGSALDQVILYCFQYDPNRGSYVPHAMNIMKLAGLLTILVLGAILFIFWRRENRRLDDLRTVRAAAP